MGLVERFHGPLRRIMKKVRFDVPTLPEELILSIATKYMNDLAGPDGYVPTLLVFGTMPSLPTGRNDHSVPPTNRLPFAEMKSAREEFDTIHAELWVRKALRATPPTE
eukprot:Plantae.Rhodophyta-Rhodochaete_pulchella.ctg82124.p1 GENE.Plantae.Rhodophyta-Rhodochaete_pulchella.ctg82124~~Plantae.Rhodophyta-Rhodochaete_pulchella.ctg82124.p1  ORF type:complete len:108 (-),score=12.91 Plantae.Rhodophyta-Rhodochaete_pulchella.ctg82124:65-388(-)